MTRDAIENAFPLLHITQKGMFRRKPTLSSVVRNFLFRGLNVPKRTLSMTKWPEMLVGMHFHYYTLRKRVCFVENRPLSTVKRNFCLMRRKLTKWPEMRPCDK